jgi:hypothetical protein
MGKHCLRTANNQKVTYPNRPCNELNCTVSEIFMIFKLQKRIASRCNTVFKNNGFGQSMPISTVVEQSLFFKHSSVSGYH